MHWHCTVVEHLHFSVPSLPLPQLCSAKRLHCSFGGEKRSERPGSRRRNVFPSSDFGHESMWEHWEQLRTDMPALGGGEAVL